MPLRGDGGCLEVPRCPKDDQALRALKLDLIERLKKRKIPREKISLIVNFIKFFVPFTNSEIQANFEQDLITLTNACTFGTYRSHFRRKLCLPSRDWVGREMGLRNRHRLQSWY